MSASAEFAEFWKDQLAGFGPITIRKMFGGVGIYHDGLMFALVVDDTLYLKADTVTHWEFESEGLAPFTYDVKDGKNVVTSYPRWQVGLKKPMPVH